MEYSANQINNLLRTYPQHLKVRPTLRDKETRTSYDPNSVDRVSISPEGKRRLQEAQTRPRTSSQDHGARHSKVQIILYNSIVLLHVILILLFP
jgi:hypothetical protein